MARFCSNENFPFPVVEALRRLGHDVLTIQETGLAGTALEDEKVLAFAVAAERAVLTLNRRDFVALHKVSPNHSGIVVCTVDSDFAGQANRIDGAIAPFESLHGHLVRVNR